MLRINHRVLATAAGLLVSSTIYAWSNGWIGSPATPATTPVAAVEEAPNVATICPSSDPPNAPDAFAASPGNWANPDRYGTGWTLSFDGGGVNRRLLVTWHTFDAARNPIWIQSDVKPVTTDPVTGEERWSSPLYQFSWNYVTNTRNDPQEVGRAWLTFPSDSATHAAVRWRWNRISTSETFDECIYDFYRGASRNAEIIPNAVNPAYTANWFDRNTSGWGIDINVGQTGTNRAEQSLFDIYDSSGRAIWFETQTTGANWQGDAWLTRPVIFSKFNYSVTSACGTSSCRTPTILPQPASSYSRAFTSANKGVVQLKVNTAGQSGIPAVDWPPAWSAAPAGELTGCPGGSTCRPIWRGTDTASVMVAQMSCTVPTGLTQCAIDVSWVTPADSTPAPQVYRVDASTLASTPVGSAGISGQVSDRLNAGARVYYEVRRGGTTLAASPIVQAYGTEVAATPPAPLVPAIPPEDAASTSVGYTPGNLRIDEGGSATYRVPVVVPPGRGGMMPELAIAYSSGAGDGIAGWGASLEGIGVISRCRFSVEAGDGSNAPMTMWPYSHGYCLDGQRLVRVGSGEEGAVGTEYRTEIDGIRRIVVTGSEVLAPNGSGTPIRQPTEFEVRGKEGTIAKYGTGTARRKARISSIGVQSSDYTVDWWLASMSDTVGNTVSYTYNEGVANALDNGTLYLTSINWVGGSVAFDYAARPQPSVSYTAYTARVSLDRWLSRVTVRSAQGATLRWYDLQYEAMPQNASLKRLGAIQECARAGVCLEPTVFDWYEPPAATAAQAADGGTNFQDVRAFKYGDVDGDGRADIVSLNRSGGLQISFSRPTSSGLGFSAPVPVLTHCEVATGGECFDPQYEGYSRSWAILDFNADGHDDLLIYTGNAWRVRLSNGSTFAASGEYVLAQSAGSVAGQAPSAFVADFDGDGLPDVLTYDATVGPNVRAWLMRKEGRTPGSPYVFSGPYTVRYPLGGACSLGAMVTFDGGRSEAVDFNGDGRADFAARTANGNCLASTPEARGRSAEQIPDWTTIHAENPDDTLVADLAAPTAVLTFTSLGIVNNELTFAAGTKILGVLTEASSGSLQFADINGDANTDLLWRSADNRLYHNLGIGAGKFANAVCARPSCPAESDKDVRLADFDGDGRLDLWRQNGANDYVAHLWTGDGSFDATERATLFHGGDSTWMRSFADLDGDGQMDNVIMRHTQVGAAWKTKRTTDHHKPRNLLKSVGHGLGAVNTIEYSPLTFATVYQREYNAVVLASGRGSPVQDAMLPRFVTTQVKTSSPVEGAADAMIATRYRYAGLKMQGGGRGSLGFRRVYTYTNLIETMTEYHQAFPLTGRPRYTQARSALWSTGTCEANPDDAACMLYGGWNGSSGSTGAILSESTDTWAWRNAAGTVNAPISAPEPLFVYRTRSETRKRDPFYGLMSAEATTFGSYDAYGNLLSSDSRNYDDEAMTAQLRRVTTTNTYGAENPTNWILGRLTDSTVTTSRPGVADVSRRTIFNYSATGLLTSERLQTVVGSDATSLVTSHAYDAWGNETRKTVCGGSSAALVSCSFVQPSGITFRSSSETQVQRQTRVAFDANGLFATTNYELFASPGVGVDAAGASEVAATTIGARDGYGTPTAATGANGRAMFSATDGFGRTYFQGSNIGEAKTVTRRWCRTAARPTGVDCPADGGGPSYAAYRVQTDVAGAPTTWVYLDRLDREVLSVRQSFANGEFAAVRQTFDTRGRKLKTTQPYFTHSPASAAVGQPNGAAIYATLTYYDALDRIVQVVHPNGVATDIANNGRETVTTLPANTEGVRETKRELRSALGELVTVFDHIGSRIDNGYDASGNVVSIARLTWDGIAATTTVGYDALGRKTSMNDPDAGTWNYAYNAVGEETRRWSGATCTATRYDSRGRVFDRKDYHNASCAGAIDAATTVAYDTSPNGLGVPATVTNQETGQPLLTRTHGYDAYGREVSVAHDFDAKSYRHRATFDQFGRTFQTFFEGGVPGSAGYIPPGGELFEYGANGYRTIVRNAYPGLAGDVYSEVYALDARGNVASERRANNAGLQVTRQYEPSTGRLTGIATAGGTLQNLVYTYDALGNMASRSDYSSGLARVERAHYDGLQRLTNLETQQTNGAFLTTQSFVHDGLGNLLGGDYDRVRQPLCNAAAEVPPGPGALTKLLTNQFCYDARGNLLRTLDPNNVGPQGAAPEKRRLVYAAFDKVREIHHVNPFSLSTQKFVYGPERQRLRQQEFDNIAGTGSPTRTTITVGDAEIIAPAGASYRDVRRHVAGVVITRRVNNSDGAVSSTKRSYLLTDAQGSTHRLVDANGAVLDAGGTQAFSPYGTRVTPDTGTALPGGQRFGYDNSVTTQGYTGHDQLDKVGIVDMGGRIYDPVLGRFLQADPVVSEPGNLQNLNRYTYVNNNPLTYTDPTGHWGQQQQGYLRAAVAIVISVYSGGAAAGSWSFFGVQATAANAGAIAMAGGFASGAVATGNLRGAVSGAFSAAIGFGAAQYAQRGFALRAFVVRTAGGGVLEAMNGGSFGHSIVSAGLGAAISPTINTGSDFGDGVLQALLGGALSEVGGGKFANGAIGAAFASAFEEMMMRAPGSNGPFHYVDWTAEQVAEFDAIAAQLTTKVAKTERLAADMFGDAFDAFTARTGYEAGANLIPTKGGFRVMDITKGGPTSVNIPRRAGATATVHMHPAHSGDGFSGTLRFVGGRDVSNLGPGDYSEMASRQTNGYVYRASPNRASWFFDRGAYVSAVQKARAAGTDTYAEWHTTQLSGGK